MITTFLMIKEGISNIIFSRLEHDKIKNNVSPNKLKIHEKLEALGKSNYVLIHYEPLAEYLGLTEIGGRFLFIYEDTMYYLSHGIVTHRAFLKDEYDIYFNDGYDAKHFLKQASAVSITDLPKYIMSQQIDELTFEEKKVYIAYIKKHILKEQ